MLAGGGGPMREGGRTIAPSPAWPSNRLGDTPLAMSDCAVYLANEHPRLKIIGLEDPNPAKEKPITPKPSSPLENWTNGLGEHITIILPVKKPPHFRSKIFEVTDLAIPSDHASNFLSFGSPADQTGDVILVLKKGCGVTVSSPAISESAALTPPASLLLLDRMRRFVLLDKSDRLR
ncbi:hypothetical protein EVAR_2576_1 [Eumeta japonica]|uniref:Uncharacterized protein n=1 Tax=Eumeta variegata TaxID=151549 RepID=A0A4C1SPD7_EUMVA|nr:hypothetical protein EVAR_2576_1 [Eumeta japonica]